MKSTAIVCAVAAAALLTSSLSQAQNKAQVQSQSQKQIQTRKQSQNQKQSQDSQARVAPVKPSAVYYYNARGPEFRRGGRIPNGYRAPTYVVDNWRAHRLAAPPRGQHWVQVGPDFVLVAIATGVITQLILAR